MIAAAVGRWSAGAARASLRPQEAALARLTRFGRGGILAGESDATS